MADFPADVFVRGAWRVDDQEDGDDEYEYGSYGVEYNQTRLVQWRWVIVRPTTLRTSLGYSKVSLSSTSNIKARIFSI